LSGPRTAWRFAPLHEDAPARAKCDTIDIDLASPGTSCPPIGSRGRIATALPMMTAVGCLANAKLDARIGHP
jgi:hypothetical protein